METVTRIYRKYYVRQILIWLTVNLMFFGLPVCSLAGIGDGGWNIRRGTAIIDAVGGDSNATIELTSRSLSDVVNNVARLKEAGVGLSSISEPWLDITSPQVFQLAFW